MTSKVAAVLSIVRRGMLSQDEYYELARHLYEHWIAMEHMKPLDLLLNDIENIMVAHKKQYEIHEKLDFSSN